MKNNQVRQQMTIKEKSKMGKYVLDECQAASINISGAPETRGVDPEQTSTSFGSNQDNNNGKD